MSGHRTIETRVRRARTDDLDALVDQIDRCTADTLYRRFHGATGHAVRRELERIATPSATHRSWVAVTGSGRIRGTATLAWSASGSPEVAFLVEDAWFRRGIGRSLFAALAAEAHRAEVDTVVAWVQADNRRALQFLAAVAPHARRALTAGELKVTIPVVRPRAMPRVPQAVPQAVSVVRGAA